MYRRYGYSTVCDSLGLKGGSNVINLDSEPSRMTDTSERSLERLICTTQVHVQSSIIII